MEHSQRMQGGLLLLAFVFLIVLVGAGPSCVTRRCLANSLVAKEIRTQPQSPTCSLFVHLPTIQYETLSVDTRSLQFSSRLKINMVWRDPDLSWNKSIYKFDVMVLPVKKFWTPGLSVDNALSTDVKPGTSDFLVHSNGTVEHNIVMQTIVSCSINLFTYPFVRDSCPLALNGWSKSGCGILLQFGKIYLVGEDRGDWYTESVVNKSGGGDHQSYLYITVSSRPFNPFVTLILPSLLIMLADLVSFALPLGGGERNSFKVTLVLSFTMFLLILSGILPSSGPCSPLIRYHFCICLIFLVVSMLVSMVLTRLAKDGTLVACSLTARRKADISGPSKGQQDQDDTSLGISVITPQEPVEEDPALRRIVRFLEGMEAQERTADQRQRFAKSMDKICFWCYLSLYIMAALAMVTVSQMEMCKFNNLDFWDEGDDNSNPEALGNQSITN